MSLINDMLTDLESRRANELKRAGLQGEVRPLPRLDRADARYGWWLALLVAVAGAAGFGYWWTSRPAAAPVSVVPTSVPAPAPVPITPPPVSTAEVQVPVLEAPPPQFAGELDLRAATVLSQLPAEREASSTTVLRVTSTTGARTTTTLTPAAVPTSPPAVASAPAPVKPAADATAIDKRAVFASPRERLEAEVRNAAQAAIAGRTAEAIEQLRDILRQDSALSSARQALLRILLEQRRIDEMMAVLREGLDLQANQTGWAISLARLWVERGDYAAAQRVLARSASYATTNPEYLGFFAHVQFKQGLHRESAEQYQAAARLAPGEGRWWLGLGVALEADGRAGEAREAFRRALATGSLNADLNALAEQKLR